MEKKDRDKSGNRVKMKGRKCGFRLKDIYERDIIRVKTSISVTSEFPITIHQRVFLFLLVMDDFTRSIQDEIP